MKMNASTILLFFREFTYANSSEKVAEQSEGIILLILKEEFF